MAYIYDILLYPVDIDNPIYPYVQIRESMLPHIVPIVYRIQAIKQMLSLQEDVLELLIQLDSEMDVLYMYLTEHTCISRKAGSKQFSYTHRWVRYKMRILDKTIDSLHAMHS